MNEKEIKELIMKRQKNRRITCRDAFLIAEEANVPRHEIGRLLNEMEIKIHACQLGCF